MIQSGSRLKIIDNTLVKEVIIIRPLRTGKRSFCRSGEVAIASVSSLRSQKISSLRTQKHLQLSKKSKPWKRGEVVYVLVTNTLRNLNRTSGISTKSKKQTGIFQKFISYNAGIILENTCVNASPKGTRVKGPVPLIIKTKQFQKVAAICSTLV